MKIQNQYGNISKPMFPSVLFRDCYRIVDDNCKGYEVQIKRWFLPFIWFQKEKYGIINNFGNIEEAKEWIKNGCTKDKIKKKGSTVFWKNCG